MGGVMKSLQSVIKDVGKDLGKSFEAPKSLDAVIKALEQGSKPYDEVADALKNLGGVLGQVDKLSGSVLSTISKAQGDLAKDNLGLDPKNPDDKKKIDAALKLLNDVLDSAAKDIEKQTNSFSKLTDVVASAGKSKGLA